MVLETHDYHSTTPGEILNFFGVLVLMMRFQFGNRAALWKNSGMNKYMPGTIFGRFISRHRFETLQRCIRFGRTPVTPVTFDRWGPVVDFVNAINDHRRKKVIPCETICVDESISLWYVIGGSWILKGLLNYVALDRKPENGCELKTAACGRSGIILRIEIVSSVLTILVKIRNSATVNLKCVRHVCRPPRYRGLFCQTLAYKIGCIVMRRFRQCCVEEDHLANCKLFTRAF